MSEPDDLHRRIDALNRQRLEHRDDPQPPGETEELRHRIRKRLGKRRGAPAERGAAKARPSPEPIAFRRDLPRREAPRPAPLPLAGPHVPLEEAVNGAETIAPDGSVAYVIERRLDPVETPAAALHRALADALSDRRSGLWVELDYLGIAGRIRPEDLIFLDLETTGLGSTPLFLIGAMVCSDGGLAVRQYFARDYSEELAVLRLFLELAGGRGLLVTFNGKSFDLPFVRARAAANGLLWEYDPPHLDLLHAGRRIWKHCLPDCRLQTLERHVCGRMRHDDIPGAFIPDAYHEYVRTGNAARMVSVLEHNFLDLITLADILTRMPGRDRRGETRVTP